MNANIIYLTNWGDIPVLAYMIGTLLFWTAIVSALPQSFEKTYIRYISIGASSVFFLQCLQLLFYFNYNSAEAQFSFQMPLIPEYNLILNCGIDGLSMCFLLLTAFIIPICLISSSGTVNLNYKEFVVCILIVELFLIMSFCSQNLYCFFIFFEGVLLPMYIIVGNWGGRNRKINAAYYFFLYTLSGSFFLLCGLLHMYELVESFDYEVISQALFHPEDQVVLFIYFFIPFAIKIPMYPFHIWLPEAHVEAPTMGSVILASLLLKLGGYGFLRFILLMFPDACIFFQPAVVSLAAIGVIYASLCALRQSDLKRIIAYSSIAHMNLVILGLFSFTHQGIDGAIYLMMGHGIVSAALFLCLGDLYERYHTRLLKYYSGLALVMPYSSMVFLLFVLGNMSFPGTSNFIGEFLILAGIFENNPWTAVFGALGIILSAIYSIWLFNRIFFGTLKTEKGGIEKYMDLHRVDFCSFLVLVGAMLGLGVYSEIITDLTMVPLLHILERYW